MDNNKYCVIIVNYNSTDYAIKCLKSLGRYIELKDNVIVVDNCSIDNPERILEHFSKIKLIRQKKNIGFSAAVNRALRSATKCDYIILINPDCKVEDDLIAKSILFMEKNPNVGILGPKILDPDGCIQGSARSFPTPLTALFGRKSPLTKLFPNNRISCRNILTNSSDGNSPMKVDWVSGACMIIRRECLASVGSFDERFFIYWEDTDICKRAKDAGWKVIYYPKIKVTHQIGVSSTTRPVLSICHFHKSCYLLYKKYAKWPKSLLEPLAIIGLGFRCCIVILINLVNYKREKNNVKKTISNIKNCVKPSPIKVLRVISRLNIGGPAIHVSILTKGLDPRLFRQKLVIGQISDHEGDMEHILNRRQQEIIHIRHLQREISPLKDIRAFFSILNLLNKEKPEIVHTHLSKAGALVRPAIFILKLIAGRNIKTVHTFHGHVFEGYFGRWKSRLYILIERFLAKMTDVVIVLSSKQKDELVNKYRIASKEKVRIIPLGLNLTLFENIEKKEKNGFGENCLFNEGDILIAIVGRLVPIKNHFMFLDAAKIVLNQIRGDNIKFLIIGGGELQKDLEAYSRKLGIESKIFFCGWVNDMAAVYQYIDILILTSRNEGTPVSVIEAMASGVPVIATAVGGVPDLIGKQSIAKADRNNNGFAICERGIICKKDDTYALAMAVIYILNNKEKITSDIVVKAKEFSIKQYSKQRLIDDIERLYINLVNLK